MAVILRLWEMPLNLSDVFVKSLKNKTVMTTNLCEKPDNHGAGWVIAIVIITMLLFVTEKCNAQKKL